MDSELKVYSVSDHDSHLPWSAGSVVVAKNRAEARRILDKELVRHSLSPSSEKPYTLVEIPLDLPFASVLAEGQLHKAPSEPGRAATALTERQLQR
jgi:hypothetical protein